MPLQLEIYVAELGAAVNELTDRVAVRDEQPAELALADPLTPFERKYASSGHTLHRLVVDLG